MNGNFLAITQIDRLAHRCFTLTGGQDTRRALSAILWLLESFGKSLGSVGAAELERIESELAETGCVVAFERRKR